MISANDLLHVISEIHQYSVLLLELKDAGTFAILQGPKEGPSYFKTGGVLGRRARDGVVSRLYKGEMPSSLIPLSVEKFLQEIEGKKARHLWLETVSPERKEMAFLTIEELKSFLRSSNLR